MSRSCRARATIAVLILVGSVGCRSDGPKRLLSRSYSSSVLAEVLVPQPEWRPFPTHDDRPRWRAVPDRLQRELLASGEAALAADWPALPATLFLDYERTGNRQRYQKSHYARRRIVTDMVLAECVEGEGRFVDAIVDGVWSICEESFWGVPAHLKSQTRGIGLPDVGEPIVDLHAAQTANVLAWTDYLLGPVLDGPSPLVRERIRSEVRRRILDVNSSVHFWWMGDPSSETRVNNWNPWINSNWLVSVLLLETDRDRRVATIRAINESLDNFLDRYPADGGCDEGPLYWTRAAAAVFDCLEILRSASDGAIDVYDESLIRNMASYVCRAHIHDDYFVNFADAPPRLKLNGDLVYRYGKAVRDIEMQRLGADAVRRHPELPQDLTVVRRLFAIFGRAELDDQPAGQPQLRDVWLPDLEFMVARDRQGTADGFYVAAKGGHNDESHNHNDVGNVLVYYDGQPVLIDAGNGSYTSKTFSDERYEIWNTQSSYHNVPTINGVAQSHGEEFAAADVAYEVSPRRAVFTLDLAGAYPAEARVRRWRRQITLERGQEIRIEEEFELEEVLAPQQLHFLTLCHVDASEAGRCVLTTRGLEPVVVTVIYDPHVLEPRVEPVPLDEEQDRAVRRAWGEHLLRLTFVVESREASGAISLRVVPGA